MVNATNAALTPVQTLTVLRETVEVFLYREARLLDQWQLKEWLELFSPDGRYRVPAAGAEDNADPLTTLFYIDDDHFLLSERIARLYKRNAPAEFPRSKCRRLVSNIELLGGTDADFQVAANFIVYRTKSGRTDVFPGHCLYELSLSEGQIKIQKKTAYLDIEDLNEQAKVSIIL
jgi:p-cumate 2,3-dioxygenase beta subunit